MYSRSFKSRFVWFAIEFVILSILVMTSFTFILAFVNWDWQWPWEMGRNGRVLAVGAMFAAYLVARHEFDD